jgi:hypothetical protein
MSRKGPTGFIETLKKKIIKTPIINTNVCLPIYMNGMNSNKINFLQSEFPNLTKIKPLIQNSVKTKTNNKNKNKKFSNATKKNKSVTSPIKQKVRFAS